MGQWGPCLPSQPSPTEENKLGDVLVGGTPSLHGQLHHQGLQQLLALLPLRSCWDGSHGLGCAMLPVPCWRPSRGWAGICQGTIDPHVLPTCFLPILQGTASVAMATIHSVPTLPGLSSPSTSPGITLSPSPKHLVRGWLAKSHLLQHGWWQAGPAGGQGRTASSWVSLLRLCGLEHSTAPASSVCSACPDGRKQTAQGRNRGKGQR